MCLCSGDEELVNYLGPLRKCHLGGAREEEGPEPELRRDAQIETGDCGDFARTA